jgi:hypothetical protein
VNRPHDIKVFLNKLNCSELSKRPQRAEYVWYGNRVLLEASACYGSQSKPSRELARILLQRCQAPGTQKFGAVDTANCTAHETLIGPRQNASSKG